MEPDILMSTIFQSVIGIVGIPGNCLIIFVYSKMRLTMSPHVFIYGLAIADLSSCLFTPAIIFQRVASYDSDFLCRSVTFVNYVTVYLSAFLSTSIAVDRYLAICRPLLRWMTVRRAKIVVVCCVVTSLIVSIPVFVSYKEIIFTMDSKPQRICTLDKDLSFLQALMLILLYSFSIATLLVTVVMFCKMRKAVRNRLAIFPMDAVITTVSNGQSVNARSTARGCADQQRNPRWLTESPALTSNVGNRRPPGRQNLFRTASTTKTTEMLLAATAVFFTTWVIALCTLSIPRPTVDNVKIHSDVGFVIIKLLTISFYVNHAINPFIYGLINKRFREKCKKCLSCRKT